jgi:hypothetical protein
VRARILCSDPDSPEVAQRRPDEGIDDARTPAADTPVLHLSKGARGDMVTTYAPGFERVWASAQPVDQHR